jgi:hypothetical protein
MVGVLLLRGINPWNTECIFSEGGWVEVARSLFSIVPYLHATIPGFCMKWRSLDRLMGTDWRL